ECAARISGSIAAALGFASSATSPSFSTAAYDSTSERKSASSERSSVSWALTRPPPETGEELLGVEQRGALAVVVEQRRRERRRVARDRRRRRGQDAAWNAVHAEQLVDRKHPACTIALDDRQARPARRLLRRRSEIEQCGERHTELQLAADVHEAEQHATGAMRHLVDRAHLDCFHERGGGQREALAGEPEQHDREGIDIFCTRRGGELLRPLLEVTGRRRLLEQTPAGARVDLTVAAVDDPRQLRTRAIAGNADLVPAVVHTTDSKAPHHLGGPAPSAPRPPRAPRPTPAATERRPPKIRWKPIHRAPSTRRARARRRAAAAVSPRRSSTRARWT